MRYNYKKPELKDSKARTVLEEGDTGYFGVPSTAGVAPCHRTNFADHSLVVKHTLARVKCIMPLYEKETWVRFPMAAQNFKGGINKDRGFYRMAVNHLP